MDKAQALDRNDDRIWQEKGKVLVKLGRLEEAVEAYCEAIGTNPEYASYYYERSIIYQDLGLIDESKRDLVQFNGLQE